MTKRSDEEADARGRRATAPNRSRRAEADRQSRTIRVPSQRGQSDAQRRRGWLRLSAVGAMAAAILGGFAVPAVAAQGDSVTTIDGTAYSWRFMPVDVDAAPGPWHTGSGHIVVATIDAERYVQVAGAGSCTTVMTDDGEVMDQGEECWAWTEVGEGEFGDYVDQVHDAIPSSWAR